MKISYTKHQTCRSARHYREKYRELDLEIASNRDDVLVLFSEVRPLHIERWDDSGCRNALFIKFHEILTREVDALQIDLIHLRANPTKLAITYYHIVNKNAYFNLLELKFDNDAELKPGPVARSFAAQHYLDGGLEKYDYMGDYSQYKCSWLSALKTRHDLHTHTKLKIPDQESLPKRKAIHCFE